MAVSADYLAYILDQLAPFSRVTARRMFGGVGLYADGFFFALIEDTLYFKVDDSNRQDFEARGCKRFEFIMEKGGTRTVSMSYYQVPEEVIEDSDELRTWARKALAVAIAANAAKTKPKVSNKKVSKKR
jgi:DNA transformation protein